MNIEYSVTKISLEELNKYDWIKENLQIPSIDSREDREIIRLLENPHYWHIKETLELINKFGQASGRIGKDLIQINDTMNFSRALAELFMFIHLYKRVGERVESINPIQDRKIPDLSIEFDELTVLVEIVTPGDYYGFQYFERCLMQLIKYIDIDKGFDIQIKANTDDLYFPITFPEFRVVKCWLEDFQNELLEWLPIASVGDSITKTGPDGTLKLDIILKSMYEDIEIRSVSNGSSTRSTDTKLYFDIEDIKDLATSPWGFKIKEKLEMQQAGKFSDGIVRILAVNFSAADTAFPSFLNQEKYYKRVDELVRYLSRKIQPYPPYDVVIPCVLGVKCGFVVPIVLSAYSNTFVDYLIKSLGLDCPIYEPEVATKEQVKEFMEQIIKASKDVDESID
ncbi:MAG TPA: hypothetical protein DDX29_00700 [Clostridiales bacterium]|nr:hypothetical protein [Clostridiales bacterium]